MNNRDGNFTIVKKWVAGGVGVGVLYASMVFSKNGFQFQTSSEYAWIGWLLAIAATSAQFMMTSDFRKINWSILALGVASYVYSIYTNIQGFHSLRLNESLYDVINVVGAIFMDVYPEVAIAWALGESKLGDLFGNLIKSAQNPEQLTQSQSQQPQRKGDNQQRPPYNTDILEKLKQVRLNEEENPDSTFHPINKWVQPPYPRKAGKPNHNRRNER